MTDQSHRETPRPSAAEELPGGWDPRLRQIDPAILIAPLPILPPPAPVSDVTALLFGAYPGGTIANAGVPNDPAQIDDALNGLANPGRPFVVRGYKHFADDRHTADEPEDVSQYIRGGRALDLVLCYGSDAGDVAGWLDWVRTTIHENLEFLWALQITEEPNLAAPPMDGSCPNVREALVQGVLLAHDELGALGRPEVRVGFNAIAATEPDDDFWPAIAKLGGDPFIEALDYVGLDLFPDLIAPAAPTGTPGDLRSTVVSALADFRGRSLPSAGIPDSVPVHITEWGWPTGQARSDADQARALEEVVRTVASYRGNFNIATFELHGLRDSLSSQDDIFAHLGIMNDDYSPKPAYGVYRQLIAEYGG